MGTLEDCLGSKDMTNGETEVLHERICVFHAPAHLRASLRQMAQDENSARDREILVLVMPEIECAEDNWSKSLLSAIMSADSKHTQDLDANTWGDTVSKW